MRKEECNESRSGGAWAGVSSVTGATRGAAAGSAGTTASAAGTAGAWSPVSVFRKCCNTCESQDFVAGFWLRLQQS